MSPKILVISFFAMSTASMLCLAQALAPILRLTSQETAETRLLAKALEDARSRNNRANVAWRSFQQDYTAKHSELDVGGGVGFTSDYRFAIGKETSSQLETIVVELSPAERQQLELLHQEIVDASRQLNLASKKWNENKFAVILAHVPENGSGSHETLRDGRSVLIPPPWNNGTFAANYTVLIGR